MLRTDCKSRAVINTISNTALISFLSIPPIAPVDVFVNELNRSFSSWGCRIVRLVGSKLWQRLMSMLTLFVLNQCTALSFTTDVDACSYGWSSGGGDDDLMIVTSGKSSLFVTPASS